MGARHHAAHGERRIKHVLFDFLPSFLRASAAPATERLAAWPPRPRGPSAPCRSWCTGRGASPARTSARVRMVAATSSGVSTLSVATSITPTSTSLPFSSFISSSGTCEWMHSSETWSILLFASAGKISSYWRHSLAERLLPVEVGLDAVAVADVHAVVHFRPCDGALERVDAPALHVVHVDVERRLVELDHVDAVLLQRARFLVEQLGEGHRQLHLVAVVLVGDACRRWSSARAA